MGGAQGRGARKAGGPTGRPLAANPADWGRNRDAEPYPWQVEPPGWSRLWIMLGGRGTGKTELGARKCIEHLREEGRRARVGIGAPTIGDARSVCAEGEPGLVRYYDAEGEKMDQRYCAGGGRRRKRHRRNKGNNLRGDGPIRGCKGT